MDPPGQTRGRWNGRVRRTAGSARRLRGGLAAAGHGQRHVHPRRDERQAKLCSVPIQGWLLVAWADPGLQTRIRGSAELPTIVPDSVRTGGGAEAAGPISRRHGSHSPGRRTVTLERFETGVGWLSSSSRLFWRLVRRRLRSPRSARFQAAASRAPAGISPVSTKRHSAIRSLRMSATIRIFIMRPLAPARRARYHCASALSG